MESDEEVTEIIIPEDKETLCRFCLKICEESLWKIDVSEDIRWPKPDENHPDPDIKLQIKLDKSENLPSGICKECRETLDKFINFLEKVNANQEVLTTCFLEDDQEPFEEITVAPEEEDTELILKLEEEDEEMVDEEDESSLKNIPEHDYHRIKLEEDSSVENFKPRVARLVKSPTAEDIERRKNLKQLYSQPLNEPEDIIIKQCLFCIEKFANNDLYVLHYVNHVVEATEEIVTHRPYCKFCGILTQTKDEIEEHVAEKHPNREELFCGDCSIWFSCKKHVEDHMKREHVESYEEELLNDNIECPVCDEKFNEVELLIKHSLTHISKRYTCMKCKKIFVCDAARNEHLREHPQYKFRCPICKKLASGWSNLEAHIGTHSTTRDFKCDICQRSYKTKNHLIYHKSSHMRPKSVCSICGYSTQLSKDFTTHLRIHSNERPFVCTFDDCGKAYKTNSALSSHVKSHLGIKEFSCDQCDYKTSRSVGLSIHKRIHTGERPYTCNVCEKTFNRKWNLTLHLRKLHGLA